MLTLSLCEKYIFKIKGKIHLFLVFCKKKIKNTVIYLII
jgi:hypothetical protein